MDNEERFKMPTDKQLIDIAILFNQKGGTVDTGQLSEMVGMTQFVLDRLYENNDVSVPSSKED